MSAHKIPLWVEFSAIYVFSPLALAYGQHGKNLISYMWVWTIIGLWLLYRTNGFSYKSLWQKIGLIGVLRLCLMAVVMLFIGVAITWWINPERVFRLPLERPERWLLVMLFYPILSALPQELMFRALFFERYAQIFPQNSITIRIINAGFFSFAHLIFMNIYVFILTFLGGLIFARAYQRGEFTMAFLLHGVAGNMIFTSGLGWLFYAGNL